MTDEEVRPYVGKPVRVTLDDRRVLAGRLEGDGAAYAVVSAPLQAGAPPVRAEIEGAFRITTIEDAANDPAAT